MFSTIKSSHRELQCSLPAKAGALMFEPRAVAADETREPGPTTSRLLLSHGEAVVSGAAYGTASLTNENAEWT